MAKKAEEVKEEPKKKEKKIQKIEDLSGVGPETIKKLEAAGIYTLSDLGGMSPGMLLDNTGIGLKDGNKMINEARNNVDMSDFTTGYKAREVRLTLFKVSTGSPDFDNLLGGGIESASLTEIFAEFGGGKTQLAHLMAVNCIQQDPTSYVVYIDTEGTFRHERIEHFAKARGLNPDDVLKRILLVKCYNSSHQYIMTEKIKDLINKDNKNVKLVIVDSLTAHFRAEFMGRGTLNERQQTLNRYMHLLMKMSSMENFAVYVTNQVMAKPDAFFGDPTQAIGGHIVGHNSTTRIYLRKGKKGSRVAKLIDSPNLADGECSFYITEGGLEDVK